MKQFDEAPLRVHATQLRKNSVLDPVVFCVSANGRLALTKDAVRAVLVERADVRMAILCDCADNTGASVTNAAEAFMEAVAGFAWPQLALDQIDWVQRDRIGSFFRLKLESGVAAFEPTDLRVALNSRGVDIHDEVLVATLDWAGVQIALQSDRAAPAREGVLTIPARDVRVGDKLCFNNPRLDVVIEDVSDAREGLIRFHANNETWSECRQPDENVWVDAARHRLIARDGTVAA